MVDSAFWRTQAERFDALHDATSPLNASFNPKGWGDPRVFPSVQQCVSDRWGLDGAGSTIDQFKSVAGVCAVALGSLNSDDVWADWLDYLRRESVDFEHGFEITTYVPDARPDPDAEQVSTTLGEIEDVCLASSRFCRKLADECQKAELTGNGEAKAHAYKSVFGRNVDRLRKECGWTFELLAEKVSFDKTTVLDHVRGGAKPRPGTIKAYAEIFTIALGRPISVSDLES